MTPSTRRLNNEQLLGILSLSKDATAVYTGEDLIIEMANDAMIGFWGKDRNVIGQSFMDAVPELIGQPFFGLLQEVWRSGITYQATDTAAQLRVDGELQWFYYDFEYRAIKDKQGNVHGILHTATDVTERHFNRRQLQDGAEREQQLNEELTVSNEELASANEELVTNMEVLAGVNETLLSTQKELLQLTDELEKRVADRIAELSESEDRFRNMAECSDVLIAVADESSKGTYFNKAWTELTGKSEAELLEFGWAELIHPEDKKRWLNTYLAAAEKQASVNGEFRILSKNGDYRWLLAKIPARFRPDGSFAGYISSCLDITELKGEEQQKQQLINMLPAAVVVIRGPELIVEMVNQSNLNYWNKSKDEVIGKPLLEILPELAEQAFPAQLRQVMETGVTLNVKESPVLFEQAGGRTRETFVDYTYQALTDASGKHTGVLVMSFEITDRVTARKLLEKYADELEEANAQLSVANNELASSEARFKYLIQEAPVAIGVLNGRELVIDAANDMILRIWGKSKAIIGMSLGKALPELEGQPFLEILDNVFTSGKPFYGNEVRAMLGELVELREYFLNFVYQPIADASGQTTDILVVATDVTEQVNARKAVEEAEERLRMATESGELAAWQLNEKLGKVIATPRFNQLFGFLPDEEVPYEAAISQIAPDYRQMVQDAVAASFSEGAHFNVEYPLTGFNNGKLRWVRSVGKFVRDEAKGNYITGVMADITEQKMDDIRKNDFIGMVSHELKTPLTSLTALLQVASLKLKDTEDNFLSDAMTKCNTQVKRMTAMINGFLNISRLESGKIHIEKQSLELGELIDDMISEAKLTVGSHVICFMHCPPITINADRDKIGSVISNLISNAVKYSPKGKQVEVACVIENNQAVVSVKDEGIGVNPEDLEKIFDRYYRVETSQTRHISGFGIGLYLSAEIIRRHGGRIWADSKIGEGSTFYFSLPFNQDHG